MIFTLLKQGDALTAPDDLFMSARERTMWNNVVTTARSRVAPIFAVAKIAFFLIPWIKFHKNLRNH